jgi:Protein of unknown function (DUF2934)
MSKTSLLSHEDISRRAHQIWEETGQRAGNETAHWLQAENELQAQHEKAVEANVAHGKSVEPPVTGKHATERAQHSTNYVHPGVTTDSLHHVRNR